MDEKVLDKLKSELYLESYPELEIRKLKFRESGCTCQDEVECNSQHFYGYCFVVGKVVENKMGTKFNFTFVNCRNRSHGLGSCDCIYNFECWPCDDRKTMLDYKFCKHCGSMLSRVVTPSMERRHVDKCGKMKIKIWNLDC